MRSLTIKTAVGLSILSILLLAGFQPLQASDLASKANIFMFSKPMPVSSLVLKNSTGRTVSLGDFRGKVVLLRFSSVNCPACRVEEPLLDEIQRRFGPAGLEIVGVNLVDSPQEIEHHAAATKASYPVFFGGNGFSLQTLDVKGRRTAVVLNPQREAILEVPGFPTTYILDCRGLVVGYSVGAARWNDGSAVALIESLVGDRAACKPRAAALPQGPARSYGVR
jgi:thiol-disulfide isomerase/thioredoxin